jgi:hypothetical protein
MAAKSKATTAQAALMVATETFSATHDGREVVVHAAQTRLLSSHEIVRANPHLFEQVTP